MLGQLIELVNALPSPFSFPPDWDQRDQTERVDEDSKARQEREAQDYDDALRRAIRPIEARLLHPEVIKLETDYDNFDLEMALEVSLDFARKFENAFSANAGQFSFYKMHRSEFRGPEPIFDEFLMRYGQRMKKRMAKSLKTKYRKREFRESRFGCILMTRLERFGLANEFRPYLRGDIFPPIGPARSWGQSPLSRWYDLWDAAYKLWGDAHLFETQDRTTWDKEWRPRYLVRYVDENGYLREASNLYSRVIASEDIEAARLRECCVANNGRNCGKLFWAKRIDQKTCSSACSNLFHVHRFRHKTRYEKADEIARRMERERRKDAVSYAVRL